MTSSYWQYGCMFSLLARVIAESIGKNKQSNSFGIRVSSFCAIYYLSGRQKIADYRERDDYPWFELEFAIWVDVSCSHTLSSPRDRRESVLNEEMQSRVVNSINRQTDGYISNSRWCGRFVNSDANPSSMIRTIFYSAEGSKVELFIGERVQCTAKQSIRNMKKKR